VCIDFLSLERSKGGFENILVITDHYTRYALAFPTQDQRATTVAKILWWNFILHYGFPERIHSDQGANFEGEVIRQLCSMFHISKSRTTPYHPQGNGTTERYNRTLLSMLGTLDPRKKADWKEHVEAVTHAYNNTRHESTGYAPFFLMFGRHARLPVDFFLGIQHAPAEGSEPDQYVLRLRRCLEEAYAKASANSAQSKRKLQLQYDRKVRPQQINIGDRVLLSNKSVRGKAKLADKWETIPYIVVGKQDTVYTIRREKTDVTKKVHRNLLTPCMFLPLEDPKPTLGDHKHTRKKVSWAPEIVTVHHYDVEFPPLSTDSQLSSTSDCSHRMALQRGREILRKWQQQQ
jgi:hypothetical protein